YAIMVAGHRAGKTAFLRTLLDTAHVADSSTHDQRVSVAKFLAAAAAPTPRIRSAALDVYPESPHEPPITLGLIDTPALDSRDRLRADAVLDDIIRFLESKFAESIDHDHKGRSFDPHVHLCLYFLDPDAIVPPSPPAPSLSLVPRARTTSLSHPADLDPAIFDPPSPTSPRLARPTLPPSEVDVIRLLSTRCNVLPVVARADTVTTERLAAIKSAVRRDLAGSGIGFGIFDLDGQHPGPDPNGSAASSSSSPTSPVAPHMLRLPYALISPECYSHGDGVSRPAPPRHELLQQYTPSASSSRLAPRLVRGRFVRSYRWGAIDVLDHTHCDFMPLRHAIFLHMDTLQKYTRDYLLNKFLDDRAQAARPRPFPPTTTTTASASVPPPHSVHPIPTIDAMYPSAPRPAAHHHQIPAGDPPGALPRASSPLSDPAQLQFVHSPSRTIQALSSLELTPAPESSRQRAKKITIACNFCRSRKLKCDGQRPACHQCQKRSHACDYQAPARRRGARSRRPPGGTGSESDEGASGDDASLEPSLSPEVKPEHLARPSLPPFTETAVVAPPPPPPPPPSAATVLPPLPKSEPILPTLLERRAGLDQHQPRPFLPPLARPPDHASAPPPPILPPIRGGADPEPVVAPLRKRAGTSAAARAGAAAGGTSNRAASHYGPKVVACNHCRARKTKCDGLHPTCSSCARRSLQCNYVNDPNGPAARRRVSHATATPEGQSQSASSGPPSA
ncbi:hypothetical protein K488DRAFT_11043, partial [Vararia minispora EC-137]